MSERPWIVPELVEDLDADWDPDDPDGTPPHWAALPGVRDAVVHALAPLGHVQPYDPDAFIGALMETPFLIVKADP
jgi:hypothetical protein